MKTPITLTLCGGALLATLSLTLMAQEAPPESSQNPPPQHGRPNPLEKLNLTDEQKAQVQPIMEKAKEARKAIFENATLSKEERQQELQAIRDNTDDQLKVILTPEQYQQFEAMKAEMKKRFGDGPKPDGQKGECPDGKCGPKPPGGPFEQLGLTDSQKSQVEAIKKETHDTVEQIRQNASLTEEQKKEQAHAAFKASFEKIKAVLTPDQVKKLESLRAEHPGGRFQKGTNGKTQQSTSK